MATFDKPFEYNPETGKWSLELHKASKGEFAQCGMKITIDTGFPTGEIGAFYQTKFPSGMMGGTVEVRFFDNLSSWTSTITFDIATLFEKLIELIPKDKVKTETFVLSENNNIETNDKLYISNMCQAGWISKIIQKCPYKHPFLFCCFLEDDFIKFIEDFDKIDYKNYKKLHYNESKIFNHKNRYQWNVFNNALKIKTDDTLAIEFNNGVQIMYPHTLYKNFDNSYNRRLERFIKNKNKEICFIFRVKNFMSKELVDKFYNFDKFKKILLFDEDVSYKNLYKENYNTKIVITSKEHNLLVSHLIEEGLINKF